MKCNRRQGFTLIELLLVVVIIGILAAIVVPKFAGRTVDAQIAAAKAQVENFGNALDAYEIDNGRYPTTQQGLDALIVPPASPPEPRNWKGPYLKAREVPLDPWGTPYLYLFPGELNPAGYDLLSVGPDGDLGNGDDIGE